jgi:large conductance mechanosensitive channel
MGGLVGEFKTFVLRSNVLGLAIAVVIGAAFVAIVSSFVENIGTPLIAAVPGQPDFLSLMFTINNSEIRYGVFINSVVTFLIIALVIFFLVIKPVNTLMARTAPPTAEEEPAVRSERLSGISPDANQCPNCTPWLRGPNVAVS